MTYFSHEAKPELTAMTSPAVVRSLTNEFFPEEPLALPSATPAPAAALADAPMPDDWLDEPVPRHLWESICANEGGHQTAPLTVQAEATMNLVHFYFQQLTLNAVLVVERGRFVGMIRMADFAHESCRF